MGSSINDHLSGCFEHYATLRKHDANFSRYLKATEWLSTYDLLSGEMCSEREYTLLQYLPYTLVPFYPIFQERGCEKVERPKADWEVRLMVVKNHDHINLKMGNRITRRRRSTRKFTSLWRDVSGQLVLATEEPSDTWPVMKYFSSSSHRCLTESSRHHFGRCVCSILTFVFLLKRVQVNQQVIKPDERALLSRLVDIMAALELRFIQERSEDGQLMYRLDP